MRSGSWFLAVCLAACAEPAAGIVETPVGEPASATVGAAGGTLTSTDGRLTLTIPPGALSADAAIEIQEIEWEGGRAWSLRPDGLAFATPVTATITLSEEEVGAPTTETIDGEPLLDLPLPHFGHFSFAGGTADETVELEVARREADAEIDYALALSHFSTVTYIQTERGRVTDHARVGLGETFRVGSYARRGTRRVSLVTLCGRTWERHEVDAQLEVVGLEVTDYDRIYPTTSPVPSAVREEDGLEQYFECASVGTDAFVVESITRLFETTGLPRDCRNLEPTNAVRRQRTVECADECPFPDPIDLSATADGDPALDLRCARTGAYLSNGRPWVRAVFEGPWPPSSDFYSWYKRFTFYGASGELGSYTREHHDGMDDEIFTGALTMGNTRVILEPTGCVVEVPTDLGAPITSVTVESGILKTPTGTFLMDQIMVSPFDFTPRQI